MVMVGSPCGEGRLDREARDAFHRDRRDKRLTVRKAVADSGVPFSLVSFEFVGLFMYLHLPPALAALKMRYSSAPQMSDVLTRTRIGQVHPVSVGLQYCMLSAVTSRLSFDRSWSLVRVAPRDALGAASSSA